MAFILGLVQNLLKVGLKFVGVFGLGLGLFGVNLRFNWGVFRA